MIKALSVKLTMDSIKSVLSIWFKEMLKEMLKEVLKEELKEMEMPKEEIELPPLKLLLLPIKTKMPMPIRDRDLTCWISTMLKDNKVETDNRFKEETDKPNSLKEETKTDKLNSLKEDKPNSETSTDNPLNLETKPAKHNNSTPKSPNKEPLNEEEFNSTAFWSTPTE